MVAPALIAASAAAPIAAASISGAFGKKKKSQVPMEPPEVAAARRKLYDFANTGTFGDFTAGAEMPLGYGDYETTSYENQGLSSLGNLLSSGIPEQYQMGDAALKDLMATSPDQIENLFNPYKTQVQRQIGESSKNLKRNAGFAGNLYSTNTIQGLGDIEARGNETLAGQLANLTNQQLDRSLSAVPLAYQSGRDQENIAQGRIAASQQFGGLTRQLNDQRIKSRDAELLRRRQELGLPIEAARSVLGSAPSYGIPSIETSPLNDLLGLVGQVGGQYFSQKALQNQFGGAGGYTPYGGGGVGPYAYGR